MKRQLKEHGAKTGKRTSIGLGSTINFKLGDRIGFAYIYYHQRYDKKKNEMGIRLETPNRTYTKDVFRKKWSKKAPLNFKITLGRVY
jgi:hypothetical protein